jgi:transcriptional regulator with XRE-family HTH domain
MAAGGREWARVRSPEDLGRFLGRLRAERGWTQAAAAEYLGIPRRYLHELEAGKEILAYTRLFRLLTLLDARLTIEAATDQEREADPWQV